MKKFKVWAKCTTYLWLDVEAQNQEEAERIAEQTDGGDFEEDYNICDWEIVNTMTTQI